MRRLNLKEVLMRGKTALLSAFIFLLIGFGSVGLAVPAWAGDGVVALQSADPSCRDDSGNIYVNCNGTVTDNRTGLVWLQNANCFTGAETWFTAMEVVAGLSDLPATSVAAAHDCGLSDGSSAGGWRLPTLGEWEAMVADAVALGCMDGASGGPSITDDAGAACWQEGSGNSFTGVVQSLYWSSTTKVDNTPVAWGLNLIFGVDQISFKSGIGYFWPVRGGQ